MVRYKGEEKKRLWPGRLLSVHERDGEELTVWDERKLNGEYTTLKVSIKEVEEVC